MAKRHTTNEFVVNAKNIHGNKYDYSLVDYKTSKEKIIIICEMHGEFTQSPNHHLNGRGCPTCGYKHLSNINDNRHNDIKANFVNRAMIVHGNRFEYLSKYVNHTTKIQIRCVVCGLEFEQKPHAHLSGNGCPRCNMSKGEHTIKKWLNDNHIEYEQEKWFDGCRGIKRPLPFDFWIPSKNILIEYQGRQHYEKVNFKKSMTKQQVIDNFDATKRNDKIKKQYCLDNNITLLEIPYWCVKNIDKILIDNMGE